MNIKKVLAVGVLSFIAVALTGCDGENGYTNLVDDVVNHGTTAINTRAEENKSIAQELVQLGFLSDTTCNSLIASIDSGVSGYQFKNSSTSELAGSMTILGKSAVEARALGEEDIPEVYYSDDRSEGIEKITAANIGDKTSKAPCEGLNKNLFTQEPVVSTVDKASLQSPDTFTFSEFAFGNYILGAYFPKALGTVEAGHWYLIHGYTDATNDKNVTPIKLLNDDTAKEINSRLQATVYVLRSDITTTTKDDVSTTDGIIKMIQSCCKKTSSGAYQITDQGHLNNYFVKATYKGKDVKLVDTTTTEFSVVGQSTKNHDTGVSEPGKDLVLSQFSNNVGSLEIRFTEFNKSKLDKLIEAYGLNADKWVVFAGDGGQCAAYLMEYPVYRIDTMENDSDNSNNVNIGLKQSGIGVNLLTGQFIKYKDGKYGSVGKALDMDDNYLTVEGATNQNETSKSSLVVKGVGKVKIQTAKSYDEAKGTFKMTDLELTTGRVVLRDYLEATFAPEYETGDTQNVAVFGRKIRFDMDQVHWVQNGTTDKKNDYILQYSKDQTVAQYVDKDGELIAKSPKLQITDFCNLASGTDGQAGLFNSNAKQSVLTRLNKAGEKEATIKSKKSASSDSIPTIKTIASVVTDKIEFPVAQFPGANLGSQDYPDLYTVADKPVFYAIGVNKGIFDGGLFSGWINSTADDASLDWWDGYLGDHSCVYTIGHESINSYLEDNFTYEMQEQGQVIINPETVKKIQKIYDEDSDITRAKWFRGFSVVLGIGLIWYAVTLLVAWLVDTTTDIGLNLMGKMSFGHWIAIKYEDDAPDSDMEDRKYLTFSKTLLKTIIIIIVGILLIASNVLQLLLWLINIVGGIATQLSKIIQGYR